jgi:hypothetical protein
LSQSLAWPHPLAMRCKAAVAGARAFFHLSFAKPPGPGQCRRWLA